MAVDGWREATLADVAKINALSLSSGTPQDYKLKYLDIASISETGKISSLSELEYAAAPSRARRIVRSDDIVVSTVRPYLRAFAHIKEAPDNLIASTGYAVITALSEAAASFLYQVVLSEDFLSYLTNRMKGSSYPAVTAEDVAMAPIHLPPLSEQKKIAEILGSVDEAIVKTEAVIAQTQRIKHGLLQTLLAKGIGHTKFKQTEVGEIPESWGLEKCEDVCKKVSVGIATSATHAYAETGVPLIRNQNIKDGYLDISDLLHVTKEYDEENASKRLKTGDVISMRTGYPGLSAVVPKELNNSQSFTTLVCTPDQRIILPAFLCNWINSPQGKKLVFAKQAGGAQQNLNAGSLKQIYVPIPPLEEQKSIADIIEEVWQSQLGLELSLDRLKRIKCGLMSDLLTGRVRVNVGKKKERAA